MGPFLIEYIFYSSRNCSRLFPFKLIYWSSIEIYIVLPLLRLCSLYNGTMWTGLNEILYFERLVLIIPLITFVCAHTSIMDKLSQNPSSLIVVNLCPD